MLFVALSLRRANLRSKWGFKLIVNAAPSMGLLPAGLATVSFLRSGDIPPAELTLLACVAWTALGLVSRGDDRSDRVAVLLATVVVVVGVAYAPALAGTTLLLLLAGVLSASLVLDTHARSGSPRGFPSGTIVGVIAAVLLAGLVVVPALRERPPITLHGFMPSSGGSGKSSPHARDGVGDGDDTLRGNLDARSVGFDDSDVFLNSEQPGLYDAFIESYGPPVPPGEFQKMIGLKRQDITVGSQDALNVDLRQGRQFSVQRRTPTTTPATSSDDSDVLMWVRTDHPLHLPLRVYDRFDGLAWSEESRVSQKASLHQLADPTWMLPIDQPFSDVFHASQATLVKTARFTDDVLPLPSHVERFKVGRVNRTDFFVPTQRGFFGLRGRPVPGGTVIESVHKVTLEGSTENVRLARATPENRIDGADADALRALATEIGAGVTGDWARVSTIVSRLRTTGRHDRTVATSEAVSIENFVRTNPRGPDYLFATSAALLIKAMGFETRLVSGFYADPDRTDPIADMIPIRAVDAHFWPQVLLADGTWLTIEPTPGFSPPYTSVTFAQWLARAWDTAVTFFRHHAVTILSVSVTAISVFIARKRVCDAMWTLVWHAVLVARPRSALAATWWLVERRSRLVRKARPNWQTRRAWVEALVHKNPGVSASMLYAFVDSTEAQLYGPATPNHDPDALARARHVARIISTRRLRASLLSGASCP